MPGKKLKASKFISLMSLFLGGAMVLGAVLQLPVFLATLKGQIFFCLWLVVALLVIKAHTANLFSKKTWRITMPLAQQYGQYRVARTIQPEMKKRVRRVFLE